jgi:hypothetical protein
LIEYIICKYKFNIAKNKRDESVNKLTASELIAKNGLISTNVTMPTIDLRKIQILEIVMLPELLR